jgi:hypothetical protein
MMGKIVTRDFYPDNGTTDATQVNTNYTTVAIEGSALNEDNIRVEGIDTRNLAGPAMILKSARLANGYDLDFPATPAAGAQYPFYTDSFPPKVAGTPEWPINHDATGATNTAPGQGTKLVLNQAVQVGDIVRIRWWINQFSSSTVNSTTAQDHSSQLIYIGARPAGGTNGSGVGEWCAIAYPKINTTSAALNDVDFTTVFPLANVFVVDPPNVTPGIANPEPITGGRFDHCTFIPHFIMTAGNSNTSHAVSTYIFDQLGHQGEFIFRCNVDTILFGVQLYFSGAWRMDTDGAGGPALFLEDQICDPANLIYGVNGTLGFERTYIETTIYRNTAV